jgi:hypothetical protein
MLSNLSSADKGNDVTGSLALVLSIVALLVSAFHLSLRLARTTEDAASPNHLVYISESVLLDQRSFLQAAMRTMALHMESDSPESRDAARRVVQLLTGSPLLVASPIVPDVELAHIERRVDAKVIWIVSGDDEIEFAYPELGGAFSAVVMDNLSRGIKYRYLVPDSLRSRQRKAAIAEDYPAIEVRFLDQSYWNRADRLVEEYIIYDSGNGAGRARDETSGYYLYPRSNPRRWIKMDNDSAFSRLRDAQAQWELSG